MFITSMSGLWIERLPVTHKAAEKYMHIRNIDFTSLTVQIELQLQTHTYDKSLLQKQTRARRTYELTWVTTTGFSFKIGSFSKIWAKVSVPSPPKPLANAVMAGKTASGRSSHFTKSSMNSILKEL